MSEKKARTRYLDIKLNLGKAREQNYLTNLRNRYGRPKSGLARLIMCAIREVLAMQAAGIPVFDAMDTLREDDNGETA